jgi:hypothetical protein
LKFVLDGLIVDPPKSFFSAESATEDPLAAQLFGIPGVNSLLFLGDFITINKSPNARWADIRESVKQVLENVERRPLK